VLSLVAVAAAVCALVSRLVLRRRRRVSLSGRGGSVLGRVAKVCLLLLQAAEQLDRDDCFRCGDIQPVTSFARFTKQ